MAREIAILNSNRTFGCELEALWPSGNEPSRPERRFRVVSDGSLEPEPGTYTYEVQCGVFSGQADLEMFAAYVKNEREHGMRVNRTCGGHVHIGVPELEAMNAGQRFMFLYNLYDNFVRLEDAIYALNGGEERKRSSYAKSVRERFASLQQFGLTTVNTGLDDRYYTLNVASLYEHHTVEFRIFRGSNNEYVWAENIRLAIAIVEKTLTGMALTCLEDIGINRDNFAAYIERFHLRNIATQVKALRQPYGKFKPDMVTMFKTVRKYMASNPSQTDKEKAYLYLREMSARMTNIVDNKMAGYRSTRHFVFIQLEPNQMGTIVMHSEGNTRKLELGLPNKRDVVLSWNVEG